jgi:acetoin utilization deacetylase AcuC-like enzyme
MHEIFIPLCEQFKPELFAVSAGFDAHTDDPLTDLQLSTNAYGWLAGFVDEQTKRLCNGRTVFVLEGGYDLKALSGSVTNIVRALSAEKFYPPSEAKHPKVIDEIRRTLSKKWDL